MDVAKFDIEDTELLVGVVDKRNFFHLYQLEENCKSNMSESFELQFHSNV